MIGITGASGFVGNNLLKILRRDASISVRAFVRRPIGIPDEFVIEEIDHGTDWTGALESVRVAIHCAAHVHQNNRQVDLRKFQQVNTEGTLGFARAAVQSGVKRFVFLSSVKAMGECSAVGRPFRHTDQPAPIDLYGESKWEAEQGLWEISRETGLEVVVIRPPLVYGPGVGANFRQLMRWISRGVPLPVGMVRNKRSLVALPNLIDLITTCVEHPAAPGNTFLVSDGQDLSTPELVSALARALGSTPRMFPCPLPWLTLAAGLLGRSDAITRLTQSLQVDITHTQSVLGWAPVCSVEQGMAMTAKAYLAQ